MRKHNLKLILSILVLVCFGAGIFVTQAMEQAGGRQGTVTQNQAVEDDLILAGRTIRVQAEVKQDIIAAGEDESVSGAVTGYLIAVA